MAENRNMESRLNEVKESFFFLVNIKVESQLSRATEPLLSITFTEEHLMTFWHRTTSSSCSFLVLLALCFLEHAFSCSLTVYEVFHLHLKFLFLSVERKFVLPHESHAERFNKPCATRVDFQSKFMMQRESTFFMIFVIKIVS